MAKEASLSARKASLLKFIVSDYVSSATPVGSERIVTRYRLGVSPATIRNDMAELEDAGYITHPHTSAGRIPADKGYRYYVETLMEDVTLPLSEQLLVRHQFHQLGGQMEEWTELAVAVLARLVHNLAIVTMPKETRSRIKRLELVALHEFLALLVLLMEETRLKRELLPLSEPLSQTELDAISIKLNQQYVGLTTADVASKEVPLSPVEGQVVDAMVRLMKSEDSNRIDRPIYEGLRHFLGQPEVSKSARMLDVVEALEARTLLSGVLAEIGSREGGVQIVISKENPEPLAQECSIVLTRYGIGGAAGYLGVLGPTRMDYPRTISIVRYIAAVMNELLNDVH
ncbi:MAG: heat-inducible transcription repressor HrcA [Chloroflexi bacterium]|nr:heat-inducible transcription repressor HrcA [Chloroflexota bacterium]